MFKASDLGRTRIRVTGVDYPAVSGLYQAYLFGNLYQTSTLGGKLLTGTEITKDATHPWFVLIERNGSRDWLKSVARNPFFKYILKTGGDFSNVKRFYRPAHGRKVSLNTGGSNRQTYLGQVLPVDPAIANFAPNPITDANLMDKGAKQIAYNMPGKPLVDMGQTLGELRKEGFPRMRSLGQFKNYSPRKGGEDYLAWQFGFRPVIQDIYGLARSIDTADKQWRSYVKGSNTLQRRHYTYPIEQSTEITDVATGGSVYPILPAAFGSGMASTLKRTRTVVTVYKFSAAYAYHVPKPSRKASEFARRALQYQKQYGLEIDPELLWNLSPWSWLIDWFLPVGDFVSQASNLQFGNTALPWAYMSASYRVSDVYERPGCRLIDGKGPGTLEVVTHYKRRVTASPYGFGVAWNDLSAFQLSILAAIGISR